jgi:hypothetical protein
MDRSDEIKRNVSDVESGVVTSTDDERTGDVLGLSGAPVPKLPGDPSAESDPESVAQRRARMRSGEDEGVASTGADRSSGATGIDMGAGGTGTGVSES